VVRCRNTLRQSRERLFKECLHWKQEIKELWRRVQRELGWRQYRWKPISALFNESKATGAILEFLEKTRVGTMRGGIEREGFDED
jgi:hypothetical protein